MKFIYHKKIVIIVLILGTALSIGLKFAVWDNADLLCKIAEGFDEPSTPYYFVLERIYKLSTKENVGEKIAQYLAEDENRNLHDIYIRILGILGYREALQELEHIYTKYQHDQRYKATLYYTIKSMGLIGDRRVVPLLETLLKKQKELNVQVSESNIATALYLITGNSDYYFTNTLGESQKLILTEILMKARRIIVSSKGRSRTYEEMLILDNVFRPPAWQTL